MVNHDGDCTGTGATFRIEGEFRTQPALEDLVGEKFLNFVEAAEADDDSRAEIPAFVAEIKILFERWQLLEYLERARETEPSIRFVRGRRRV